MGENRKSYSIIYFSEKLDDVDREEVIAACKQLNLEYDIIEEPRNYNAWFNSKDSINPSLFITDVPISESELSLLDEKLNDAIILMFGDGFIAKYKRKALLKQSVQPNLIKVFNQFSEMLNYITEVAPPTKKFKEKVYGVGSDAVPDTKIVEMEETVKEKVESAQLPNVEKPVQDEQKEQVKESLTDIPNIIPSNETAPPVIRADEEFDDEEINERLRYITEVANKNTLSDTTLPKPTLNKTVNKTEGEQLSIGSKRGEELSVNHIVYEEDPFHIRARHIQKKMAGQKWEGNHTVGVWSPLHRMGVTSFVINFAMFLAENKVHTAVLEGLTEQHALKSWLERYTTVPPNWSSYAKALQPEEDATEEEWQWIYRNVTFLPLDKDDAQLEWNTHSLARYMTTTNIIEMTLVDFPTGKMTSYTEDSLHYLKELWIVIDDATLDILAWKEYIHSIKSKIDIPIYIIFNKTYSFSQVGRICKELQLPLLTNIPAMHEETMRNYYENKPLYVKKEIQAKLQSPFTQLGKHLFGKDFQTDIVLPLKIKKKWPLKFFKTLKGF